MPFLGAHESAAGGLFKAFDRIEQVNGEALQIFTKNQRQWNPPPLTKKEIEQFTNRWHSAGSIEVASHGSYLVNLATGKEELLKKSIQSFTAELDRCHKLRIPYAVLHPGSHGGDGIDSGIKRFVHGLDVVFEQSHPDTMVLLETMAGQGTGIGSRFEELGSILEQSKFSERIGVCLDTCHIFAAGYDIRSAESYEQTMSEFDHHVGLDRIRFFHLNDSKKELGSRVDRHEHIGHGCIGLDGFANLLNDRRFKNHSMTLETPKGGDLSEDRKNLRTLRELLRQHT